MGIDGEADIIVFQSYHAGLVTDEESDRTDAIWGHNYGAVNRCFSHYA